MRKKTVIMILAATALCSCNMPAPQQKETLSRRNFLLYRERYAADSAAKSQKGQLFWESEAAETFELDTDSPPDSLMFFATKAVQDTKKEMDSEGIANDY